MEGILNKHFSLARNICVLLALALLLLILFPVYIKEDSASATTGTANSSSTSLTLTTSNTSANVVITPNSANGTFAMSSTAGEAQFGVATNNFTGYELSIVADDDSGNLTNTDGNVGHSIFSIDAPMTKDSFDTITYNNRWGYKPSKYVANNTVIDNTGDSAMFLPSPTTTGTILDHTTVANSSANNYSIALGIRADHNTYAGTYTKTFTLVATANPSTYTINYNKNTTDSVSNMPSTSTTGSTSSTTITLPNTVPTRAQYSFLGWCSTTTTTTNGVDSCSGTVYNPNGAGTNLTYGLDQTTANTTTLYAMWKIDTFTLTLTKGSNITNITASPSSTNSVYNYGQEIILTAYKTTDTTCKSYATPTWSTTAGTLSATSGNSITITMPASNVTVTATSTASDVAQTISLSRFDGASGINIGGTNYIGSSVSLTCGTYNISGSYDSGYEFSSWSASGSASVASTSSASTTLTVSGAGTLTLTGKQSCTALPSGTGVLQTYSITSAALADVCVGSTTTLRDNRDNMTYTIGKLVDGKIWLLDNLRLDLTNATVKANLSATNTNASNTTLNYLKNGGGTTSDKYAITGVVEWTSSPSYANSSSYSDPLIATSGISVNNDSWTKDTLQSYGSGSSKIGIYYNYCAASAGSYCYGDGTSYFSTSDNATEDICPAGWRMPNFRTEYRGLYNVYSSDVTNFKNAFRAPLSGGIYTDIGGGRVSYQGTSVQFWSSTTVTGFIMYTLNVRGSSGTVGGGQVNRRQGFPVRCILN